MAKRLAGKRWFEAQGRRAKATGVKTVPKPIGSGLPRWAQAAYSRGWFHEHYALLSSTPSPKQEAAHA